MRSSARHAARGDRKSRAPTEVARTCAAAARGRSRRAQPRAIHGAARDMRSSARHAARGDPKSRAPTEVARTCAAAARGRCAESAAARDLRRRPRHQELRAPCRARRPEVARTDRMSRAPTRTRARIALRHTPRAAPGAFVDVPPEGERSGLSRRGRLTGSVAGPGLLQAGTGTGGGRRRARRRCRPGGRTRAAGAAGVPRS